MSIIGQSLTRPDAARKTTGETRFLTDISVENMVHGAPVFSSIPFGKFTKIGLLLAKEVEGYIDFVSAKDIPAENQIGVIIPDQPLFADKTVRYVGDSIGLVVAKTPEAAMAASRLVKVDYVEENPYLAIDESRYATENFIHKSNLACKHRVRKGDPDSGFKEADHIFEARFKTPYQEHYYLEPQACIVIPEKDGKIKILGSLQCPFYIQKAVARVFGIATNKILVEQAPTGGAFGGKEDIPSEVCARAAVAAVKIGLPVKVVYNRRDDIQLTSKRHPFQMHYKVGVKHDGTLVAANILLEENAGAYATLSTVVSYRSAAQAMGPYVIPHIHVDSNSYYTNLPPTGAFRGFGSPQAAFGHERMMDIIADKLNMDPVEIRLKNIVKPGSETQTAQVLNESVGAEETIIKAAKQAQWDSFDPGQSGRYKHGIGISTIHYGNCLGAAGWHMDGSGVNIKISPSGDVYVAYGLVEMGQGSETVVIQMTADALGVSPNRVIVLPTDSAQVPDSGPAVASRNVVMTGNAIRNATEKLMPILKKAASELMGCDTSEIAIVEDKVTDIESGTEITFHELCDFMSKSNVSMEFTGWWHTPKLEYNAETGIGEAYFSYSFATHIAKVRVDTLTGQVFVDKIIAAHDVGKAINPAGIEGQVEGGSAQGIGWATTEDFKMDRGVVTTPNLSTYLLPTALDVAEVETIIVEKPEPEGPWGAKGIGEPSIIPTAGAIANAVSSALGIQMNEIPLTPERVLNAINGKIE
ncbi:MAG: xanthine dehydrogenase family protein [Candidatus Marinimicrobia bacterium]|nr:xanthine dehydrogenase family protein [Candidatus Neomarinimicrobiota bacterium]